MPHPVNLQLPHLPITEILDELAQQLSQQHQVVLEAPPGAGKTTLVPLSLLGQPWLNKKILMLEPRRMAARSAAQRMASLIGEDVGQTVGYRIRQESRVSKNTRIEVITEGILTRMLLQDPSLEKISLLIFDEFHERSLDADTGLALALQARELFRDDNDPLKILVMSATLDTQGISNLLENAPILRSAGKMYPVEIRYCPQQQAGKQIVDTMVTTLLQVLTDHDESILAFLPGQGEIHRVMAQLNNTLNSSELSRTQILPLYGALSISEQQKAIEPLACSRKQRKLVLATDIAETSLTIEGITVVVDSGLCREPRFDPTTGMTRLQTRRISRDSSIQRMGRAGRLSNGYCYRLWNEEQQERLSPQRTAEIQQADLAPLVLQLLSWGASDIHELQWLDSPPAGAISQSLDLLKQLGAITRSNEAPSLESNKLNNWQLSPHGEYMAGMPTHPRLAHMLLNSLSYGIESKATALAALLSDRSPLAQEHGADIEAQLSVVLGETRCHSRHKPWLNRCQRQARQFTALLKPYKSKAPPQTFPLEEETGRLAYLLACAYPDRIARKKSQQDKLYQLSNGRSAILEGSQFHNTEYLAVAELGGHIGHTGKSQHDRIYTACPLAPLLFQSVLRPLVEVQSTMNWDESSNRFVAEQQWRVGKLTIERKPLTTIDPEQKKQALTTLLHKRSLELLPWTPGIRQWQARVNLIHKLFQNAEESWPDLSDSTLLATMEQWLSPYLDNINKLSDFKQLDLQQILKNLLPWPLPQQLEELAPTHIAVPSGSRIAIDYLQYPPVLNVKLQEMFGCQATPTIARGKVPLMLHLLSPAQRPLQITQDLVAFWQNSYQEVKKEMKGRYPKHPWPDDPMTATATRLTKKRLAERNA